MLIILSSILLLSCYTLGNRLIGSPEWKKFIPMGRVVAYVSCFISCLALCLSGGLGYTESFILSGILGITFLISRQRSPRGSFFLRTGGKAGVWDIELKKYTLLYDGKHSGITSWLASKVSGVNWLSEVNIANNSKSKSQYGSWNKDLVKYSWAYASLHYTSVFILISIIISIIYFIYSPILILLGVLSGVINYQSGVKGIFNKERGAGHRAELFEGFLIHGMFALLNILGAIYLNGGFLKVI